MSTAEKEAWMRELQASKLAQAKPPTPSPLPPPPAKPQPYGVRHPNSLIVWLAQEFWPRVAKEEQNHAE